MGTSPVPRGAKLRKCPPWGAHNLENTLLFLVLKVSWYTLYVGLMAPNKHFYDSMSILSNIFRARQITNFFRMFFGFFGFWKLQFLSDFIQSGRRM